MPVHVMQGWGEFAAAVAAFVLAHLVPARPYARRWLVKLFGERIYLTGYIVLSLGLLAWLIGAAGRAPFVPIWDFAPWQLWAPNIAMPFVCLLAAFGAGARNPLSFGGRDPDQFDPKAPGIAGMSRHPLLLAIALWAAAHLMPNGDLAHVLLFGFFVVLAIAGMLAIDRRLDGRMGEARWTRLASATSLVPLAALVSDRWQPQWWQIDRWRVLWAFALYVVLISAHAQLIGVSPFPVFGTG